MSKTKYDENGRVCTECKKYKLWHNYANSTGGVNNKNSKCCDCRNKKYNSTPGRGVNWLRKHRLGIEPWEVEEMIKQQNQLCGICDRKLKLSGLDFEVMCVDHCHKTGKIRGLICKRCNTLLGYAQDSPEILGKAIAYLVKSLST